MYDMSAIVDTCGDLYLLNDQFCTVKDNYNNFESIIITFFLNIVFMFETKNHNLFFTSKLISLFK